MNLNSHLIINSYEKPVINYNQIIIDHYQPVYEDDRWDVNREYYREGWESERPQTSFVLFSDKVLFVFFYSNLHTDKEIMIHTRVMEDRRKAWEIEELI